MRDLKYDLGSRFQEKGAFLSFFFFFFFCSKHDLKDMFKLMDVMQGSYTVLAHVGGPLCPRYTHTGCK